MTRRGPATCLALLIGLALLPAAQATVLYAAGDIADCTKRDAAHSGAAATASLLPKGATVVMLGDASYPTGDRATLEACYGPTWGRWRETTYAVPGNHDYVHDWTRDQLAYFARPLADSSYYIVDLGELWLIGLDSNLSGAALDDQLAWLKHELELRADDGRCIVAAWHHPLYSTGLHHGDGERMRPAWDALLAAGADVVLNGHEHFYEAFGPKDGRGADAPWGMREFIVGTGGASLKDVSLEPWRHRAYAHRHGVLELRFEAGRYGWRYTSIGGRVLDSGTASCHRQPQSR